MPVSMVAQNAACGAISTFTARQAHLKDAAERGGHKQRDRPLSADCFAIACRAMDAPMLPDLLNQIPADHDLGRATADGAYDTRKCHDAIAARNAHAVIPPRKNAKV
jgi:hypothetical protein